MSYLTSSEHVCETLQSPKLSSRLQNSICLAAELSLAWNAPPPSEQHPVCHEFLGTEVSTQVKAKYAMKSKHHACPATIPDPDLEESHNKTGHQRTDRDRSLRGRE